MFRSFEVLEETKSKNQFQITIFVFLNLKFWKHCKPVKE